MDKHHLYRLRVAMKTDDNHGHVLRFVCDPTVELSGAHTGV
jgi:hypothetical protein